MVTYTSDGVSYRREAHDGNRSDKILNGLLKCQIMQNLLDTCPSFQIDGNFDYSAGVCEMPVQSHMGFIRLLPALPDAWQSGSVTGLCTCGDFEVDCTWRVCRDMMITLDTKAGQNYRLSGDPGNR